MSERARERKSVLCRTNGIYILATTNVVVATMTKATEPAAKTQQ